MKHLIICDLDGSLLNKEGYVGAYSKKVLRHLDQQGHKVIIATGRPFSETISIYEDLGIKNVLVTDNGSSIQHPKDQTFKTVKHYIPLNTVHDLFRATQSYVESAFYSDETTVYAYKHDPRLRMFFTSLDKRKVIDKPFTEFDVEPNGIIYLVYTKDVPAFEKYMKSHHQGELSYRMWGMDQKHAVYEIYISSISKATAFKHVANYYDIDLKNTIAFGDGVNDLEMLQEAGLGVAMKNGMPDVFKVCDAITEFTNDEEGIAKFLVKHFDLDI